MTDDTEDRSHETGHVFTLLPAFAPVPDLAQITSVSVVPFDRAGNIVLAELSHRGVDLPGGHVEDTDTQPEDAARRETTEEICADLGALVPAAVIQSTMHRNGKPTAMLLMTGPVVAFNTLQFPEGEKSRGRTALSPSDFVAAYQGGLGTQMMRGIVENAIAAYHPPAGYAKPVL